MSDQHGHTIDDVTDRIEQLPGGVLAFDEDESGDGAGPDRQDAPDFSDDFPSEQAEWAEDDPYAAEAEAEEFDLADDEPGTEEAEDDEFEDEPTPEEDDAVYEITLDDGITEAVPVSELAEAYLASRDLENQQAETAELRNTFEHHLQQFPNLVAQAVQERENELAQAIELWAVQNPLGEPPPAHWLDMESPEYDPDRYHLERARFEERQAQMHAAASELQRIAAQREQQQDLYEFQELKKLHEAWPELVQDSASRHELLRKAHDYYGLSADELMSVDNHRALLVLRDAIGYRDMRAEAPGVRERVKSRPRPVRPGIRKTSGDVRRANAAQQRKRLKKSGRPEDAMAVFENMNL